VKRNEGQCKVYRFSHTQAGTCKDDPLGEFYQNLLARGMEPPMARLTLARKIAAIALKIWKKGERFDPAKLKQQAV
jgi:DUF1365 family protein